MSIAHPLIVPGIRLRGGDVDEEADRAIQRAKEPWVAGFCLFGGELAFVQRLLAEIRAVADRPLFIASDMECGAGQQILGLRELPEAAVWGMAATPEEVERFGEMSAVDARSVGVDVLFAPVVDVMSEPTNPIVGHRAFGWEPGLVAALGAAYVRGALRGGALPVLKHFPGHGATLSDSHDHVPIVGDPAPRILARDLAPFASILRSTTCPAVMTAHVKYPTLDEADVIATFSRPIVNRLRDMPGTPGGRGSVVFTDALCMEGAKAGIGEAEAGRRSLAAGCDLLLVPDDPEHVAQGLRDVPVTLLAAASRRVEAFLARPERTKTPPERRPDSDRDLVADVARRAVARVWHGPPEGQHVLVLDDDGVPSRGLEIEREGRERGIEVAIENLAAATAADRMPSLEGVGTVVVMASIRASKGTEGLHALTRGVLEGLRSRASLAGRPLRVIWCGACGAPGELHVPGTGPDVERALTERLLARPA